MRFIVFFLLVAVCFAQQQANFVGRWFSFDVRGISVLATITQGSEICTVATGASTIIATFVTSPQTSISPVIAVSIDGGLYVRTTIPNTPIANVTIADNLDPTKEHNIRIIASGIHESDSVWQNAAGILFHKFHLNKGQLRPWVTKKPKILFIGDSITAGILARTRRGGSLPVNSAGEENYVHVACNILGAVPVQDGFGGTGIVVGGSGGVPDARTHSFYFMEGKPILEETVDMIVVNMGTNDNGRATKEQFKAGLVELILRLQKERTAKIVLMIPFNGAMRDEILKSASETNTNVVDTNGWGLSYTDNVHPDMIGHQVAGTKLAEALKKML